MTTMTKSKKSKSGTLFQVLGEVAYHELEEKTEKNKQAISNLVTQRVEDKFERRLVEEFATQNKELNTRFDKINDKFDSQLKWMLAFMMTQTGLIMGMIYFLHK
jgi:hypothetical protein